MFHIRDANSPVADVKLVSLVSERVHAQHRFHPTHPLAEPEQVSIAIFSSIIHAPTVRFLVMVALYWTESQQ